MEPHNEKGSIPAIISTSKDLFWKYGIKRVTVEEICKKAGVSKMTFYRNFKNKAELAEIVLTKVLDKSMEQYKAIMNEEVPFAEKIHNLVLLKHKSAEDISEEFLNDIYINEDSELQQTFTSYRSFVLKEIMKDLEEAREKGWIRGDMKLDFIFFMLNSLNEQLRDPQLLAMYDHPHDAIMDLTNLFFYGIIGERE